MVGRYAYDGRGAGPRGWIHGLGMNSKQRRIHQAVLERDDGICQDCGKAAGTVHHIVSRRYRGAWDERNMVTFCSWCHQLKDMQAGAHTRKAKIRHIGYLIERYGYDYSDMGAKWHELVRLNTSR